MNSDANIRDPLFSDGITQGDPRPGFVELGPGYLDPALVPVQLVRQWAADALDRWGPRALAYGANAGPWELRAHLARRVAGTGPRPCGPGNVIVTGGTSAALDQLAMGFAREGRVVLTEALTYDLGRDIFTGRGVRTTAVPGPADDLDVGQFRRLARRAVRASGLPPALYLIPTFHNPTGRVLSAERRREIIDLAEEVGAVVIEDQAYADLSYDGPPPPPLWHGAADPERVITLYSLAKCLAPGVRIGWLAGGERMVATLAASPVRVSGGGPNHLTAMAILAGCVSGQLDDHVSGLRGHLRARRDSLITPLAAELPGGFTVERPAGGFFAWAGLPRGVSGAALLRSGERLGVSFAAGRRFGAAARGARLCFAACGPADLTAGAARFAAACRAALGVRPAGRPSRPGPAG